MGAWADPAVRGREWPRIRREVLDQNKIENRGLCRLAIVGVCTGHATQVHHTLGVAQTGHDKRYLQAVCQPCNGHVGDPSKQPDPPHKPDAWWQ